ncbi:hypothetical protein SAMN05216345_104208 [Cupriavidus sp. YR651]|uniref:hypothetical protein n=1 Tax=Cupriavidus sp. YR651 TaxID=1855315 RepID=UPI00088A3DC8|nr:hypothetical protein [Cupriavidus sp. YR651]SDC86178.1 hypothetical protein SAMN05216345_104208 [Cupriavidus sp. YR651]
MSLQLDAFVRLHNRLEAELYLMVSNAGVPVDGLKPESFTLFSWSDIHEVFPPFHWDRPPELYPPLVSPQKFPPGLTGVYRATLLPGAKGENAGWELKTYAAQIVVRVPYKIIGIKLPQPVGLSTPPLTPRKTKPAGAASTGNPAVGPGDIVRTLVSFRLVYDDLFVR